MNYRLILLLLICLFGSAELHATAQLPDKIYIEGEELKLFTLPLESYFNEDNPKPQNMFTGRGRPNYSTACWRGYQAFWEIKDSCLYLLKIKEYDRRRFANLKKLFGDSVVDKKVKATWFSGVLRIQKGKLLNYALRGFASEYEKELIIKVKNGTVKEIKEYDNRPKPIPDDFRIIETSLYSSVIPKRLSDCSDGDHLSICFVDSIRGIYFSGKIDSVYDLSVDLDKRKIVKAMIDSCSEQYSGDFSFYEPSFEEQRWGYAGWVDSKSNESNEYLRIFGIANNFYKLIVSIKVDSKNGDFTEQIFDNFSHSVKLLDFGL